MAIDGTTDVRARAVSAAPSGPAGALSAHTTTGRPAQASGWARSHAKSQPVTWAGVRAAGRPTPGHPAPNRANRSVAPSGRTHGIAWGTTGCTEGRYRPRRPPGRPVFAPVAASR